MAFGKSFHFGLMALWLSSCAPTLPGLAIERQWVDAMKRMSMFAVFPLDEDVMVGDALLDLRGVPGKDSDESFDAFRIARAPKKLVLDALREQAGERIEIRRLPQKVQTAPPNSADISQAAATAITTITVGGVSTQTKTDVRHPAAVPVRDAKPSRAGTPPSPAPALPSVISDGRSDDALRLQLVALPSLTVARLYNAQLSGGGLIGNLAASLGIGSSGSTALTVHLKDLQSLDLQPVAATRMFEKALLDGDVSRLLPPTLLMRVLAQRWEQGAINLCRRRFDDLAPARIIIVTRVLYAGAVQYQFGRSSEFAGELALDLTASLPGRSLPTTLPAFPGAGGAIGMSAMTPEEMTARLNTLSSAIIGAPSGSLAGAQARLTVGTFGGIALDQSFERLLAVGAGGSQQYRLEDGFVPRSENDVNEVIDLCEQVLSTSAILGESYSPNMTTGFRQHLSNRLEGQDLQSMVPATRAFSSTRRSQMPQIRPVPPRTPAGRLLING